MTVSREEQASVQAARKRERRARRTPLRWTAIPEKHLLQFIYLATQEGALVSLGVTDASDALYVGLKQGPDKWHDYINTLADAEVVLLTLLDQVGYDLESLDEEVK